MGGRTACAQPLGSGRPVNATAATAPGNRHNSAQRRLGARDPPTLAGGLPRAAMWSLLGEKRSAPGDRQRVDGATVESAA
jgi:hypothetical protein